MRTDSELAAFCE